MSEYSNKGGSWGIIIHIINSSLYPKYEFNTFCVMFRTTETVKYRRATQTQFALGATDSGAEEQPSCRDNTQKRQLVRISLTYVGQRKMKY